MDRNALDWLFSTAPQALAALVGLIFAGVAFTKGVKEHSWFTVNGSRLWNCKL